MTSTYEDPSSWRFRTPSGIPYRILSREGFFEEENAEATEKYLIQAHNLRAYVLGAFPPPLVTGDFITYPVQSRLGGLPLIPRRVAWKAHIDGKPIDPFGVDDEAEEGTYGEIAEVTVNYKAGKRKEDEEQPGEEDPFTFLEISADASGQFIQSTAPAGRWQESDDAGNPVNKVLTTPIQIIVPETSWTVTLPQVPHTFLKEKFISRLRDAMGKVNSSKVDVLFDAPAETVMFLGFSIRQQFTWRTDSQPPFKLDLKFLEKHVKTDDGVKGHNDFWKADEGWQRLLFDGENPTYQSTDLNRLLKRT